MRQRRPFFSSDRHQTALRLVSHRLTFAEDQCEDGPHEYVQELWEEQQAYCREFQSILHSQVYDAAVPQPLPPHTGSTPCSLTQIGAGLRPTSPPCLDIPQYHRMDFLISQKA
jgi:hypothetical protein